MAVHAHPDDESSKGAAAMAKYVSEGVDVLVVTCTGGERGSVLNPKLDRPEVWKNITTIRRAEMDRAREILGVRQAWLGFVDSGYPEGDPLPPLPEGCFGLVPVEEGAAPLVRLIREFRPHVITTYDEEGGYPHPDHVMCHKISVEAFAAAADPERYPDLGEPWQAQKLYYNSGWSRERMLALHEAMLAETGESPYTEWMKRWEEAADTGGRARATRRPRGGRAARSSRSATRRCGPTPRRWTRTGSGSRCRWPSSKRCGRPRTSSWCGRSSGRSQPRTTCSPGSGSRRPTDAGLP